jgi:hypothetical protein
MRNIEKAIQAYGPHYQAIQQANNTIAKELAKFYERYPEFKEVAQKVDNAFKFHNHRIDEFVSKDSHNEIMNRLKSLQLLRCNLKAGS